MKKHYLYFFNIIIILIFQGLTLEANSDVLKDLGVKLKVKERPDLKKAKSNSVEITLQIKKGQGRLPVSFGLPFPPDTLKDLKNIKVYNDKNKTIPIYTKTLCHWMIDQKKGAVRSALIQFHFDFEDQKKHTIKVKWSSLKNTKTSGPISLNEHTYRQTERKRKKKAISFSYQSPKVLALIPPEWLCESLVAWQQIPQKQNSKSKWYDQHAAKEFPGSLRHLNGKHYGDHLFDRTATYVKLYVRQGNPEQWLAAIKHSQFYIQQQKKNGYFGLKKSNDRMYVYTEGPSLMYMLTGDERYKESIRKSMKAWGTHAHIMYQGHGFWNERTHGFGLLANVHAYEILGEKKYIDKAKLYFDAAYKLQTVSMDDKKPSGAWIHTGKSHIGAKGWVTSPWMSSILIDGIWKYWMISGDDNVPKSLAMYAKFTSKVSITPDGQRVYYLVQPPDRGKSTNPERAAHSVEAAYILSIGYYLSGGQDKKMLSQIKSLYPSVMKDQSNSPPRKFNWRFRSSSMLTWFLDQS